jgi:DNA-binding MarR family transcriptional regulator
MHVMIKRTQTSIQTDAENLAACTCANLRKATRLVTQAYDAALQPSGLKATQFTVLATLASLDDHSAPLTRLADLLVMDRTTLTRNLKPLVRDGLIEIIQEADQRVRNVTLTTAGAMQFEDARPHWDRVQSTLVEKLGPARWSGLLEDLGATIETLRDGVTPRGG